MSDPWLKFYPTDWRSDPALKMCSLAARGLWIEMIALMHEAVPYGHLLVSGRSPTDAQLAVLAGAPMDQITDILGELESAGVFSRTREGVIYSRKMTRTAKKAAIARKNGRKGGNPSLCKETEKGASVNQITTDEVKTQKPEARSQKVTSSEVTKARDALCEVVQPDTADAFLAHRKAMKAPLTAKAASLIASKLTGRSDADVIVLTSIERGWKGVFPPDAATIHHFPSNGGPHEQSPQHNRQLSRADATSLGFDVVARTRRASSEPLF